MSLQHPRAAWGPLQPPALPCRSRAGEKACWQSLLDLSDSLRGKPEFPWDEKWRKRPSLTCRISANFWDWIGKIGTFLDFFKGSPGLSTAWHGWPSALERGPEETQSVRIELVVSICFNCCHLGRASRSSKPGYSVAEVQISQDQQRWGQGNIFSI